MSKEQRAVQSAEKVCHCAIKAKEDCEWNENKSRIYEHWLATKTNGHHLAKHRCSTEYFMDVSLLLASLFNLCRFQWNEQPFLIKSRFNA